MVAEGRYTKFQVSKAKVTGITSSQPKESKQAYRPPGARGTQSTFKLHDDEEAPQNKKQSATNGAAAVTQNSQNNQDTNSYQGAKGILSDPEKEKKMRKTERKDSVNPED